MKRKVIRQGHNTLTLTLPAKWVADNKISPGDELDLRVSEKNIIIGKEAEDRPKKITIDINGLDYSSIRHRMRSAYKVGYDEIELRFDRPDAPEFKSGKNRPVMDVINHEVGMLLGCEIVDQKSKHCTIKDYTFGNHDDLDNLMRRIFLLFVDYNDELYEAVKKDDRNILETMYEKHFNVTKFIFYLIRSLNKGKYPEPRKIPVLYYIFSGIDDMLDISKYVAIRILKLQPEKLNKTSIEILGDIVELIKTYYQYFFKPEDEYMLRFSKKRWDVVRKLTRSIRTVPPEELFVLTQMEQCLEILHHLFEARMSLNYCRQ
ncbi:MAG: AbrB/MazE/SpoVT family DNA-binding domain-containing protein [archaeon]